MIYLLLLTTCLLCGSIFSQIDQNFIIELKTLERPLLNAHNQIWSTRFYVPNEKEPFPNTSDFMSPFKRRILRNYNIRLDEQLGKGNFGVVFKGKNTHTNADIAIKIASVDSTAKFFKHRSGTTCYLKACDRDLSDLLTIEAAGLLRGQGISGVIKLEGVGIIVGSTDAKLRYFIIIMEHLSSSKTLDKLKTTCIDRLPNESRLIFVQNILNSLYRTYDALYKKGIYHNDVKGDNILVVMEAREAKYFTCDKSTGPTFMLDINFKPYLIDFGNAVIDKPTGFFLTRNNMNIIYKPVAPPELVQLNNGRREYVDIRQMLVWYEGTIAFELCLEPQYTLFDFNTFVAHLNSGNYQYAFDKYLRKCANDNQMLFNRFIRYTLNQEPTKRFAYDTLRKEISILGQLTYMTKSNFDVPRRLSF